MPGFVTTKMSKIRRATWLYPDPQTYVRSALATLGVVSRTPGFMAHSLQVCNPPQSCLMDQKCYTYTHGHWPAAVAQLAETQCAPTGTVYRRSRGSIPRSTGRFRVRISGAHALRLISRAGKEGSTVSSIICDRWLILS